MPWSESSLQVRHLVSLHFVASKVVDSPLPTAANVAAHDRLANVGDPFYNQGMCRSIRPLFNFDPPATSAEIHAASLQFVRKLSGFDKPSQANEAAFARAVEDIARDAGELIDSLVTSATPRDRDEFAARAKARTTQRFSRTDSRDAPADRGY